MISLPKLLGSKKTTITNGLLALTISLLVSPNIGHAAQAGTVLQPAVFPTTVELIEEAKTKQKLATEQDLKLIDSSAYLADLLEDYLEKKNSPMAPCSETIIHLTNWKKIIARSAAESAFGKRSYNNNAWGVMQFNNGKATLKKMGNNWCEAVVAMDKFFNEFPRGSKLKYAQMTIEQECGVYKQPCEVKYGPNRHHWIDNNYAILDDMGDLETNSVALAEAHYKDLQSKELALAQ